MLHARIEVAQILNAFQVRCVIHEFAPGTDPEVWESTPWTEILPDEMQDQDALSITLALIRLWSEQTNSK